MGPITAIENSDRFVTVCIDEWWINIWRARRNRDADGRLRGMFSSEGIDYAHVITREEACLWERDGWSFRHRDGPHMHTAAPAC